MAAICECFFGDNDAAKASRAIDAQLREDKRKYSSELRLLLLGKMTLLPLPVPALHPRSPRFHSAIVALVLTILPTLDVPV